MGAMDHVLKQNVPYYSTMKRAGAFNQQQKPQKKRRKMTLTEIAPSGKAVIRQRVTISQAARKLHEYEETGLSPHEVKDLVERVQNLTARVKKLEDWDE